MKRIGIISDTHAYWDEKYEFYLKDCDEIWHAGDIGSLEIANKFEAMNLLSELYMVTVTAMIFVHAIPKYRDLDVKM